MTRTTRRRKSTMPDLESAPSILRRVGLLAVPLLMVIVVGCRATEKPLNVVVVTLDTVRADAIGCYGNTRVETPAADHLASEGVLFARTTSHLPITLPSHTTILTGSYPMAHGVRDNGYFVVPDRVTTLAEILAEHGYRTGASVGSFPVTAQFGPSRVLFTRLRTSWRWRPRSPR